MTMDAGSISPLSPLDLAAAWAQAIAGEGEAPASHIDHGSETAAVQTLARAPATAADAPPHADTALPAATNALSEFALPAAQLAPALLVGLQVEAAWARPLPRPTDSAQQSEAPREPLPPPGDDAHDRNDEPDAEEETPAAAEVDAVLDAPADAGCDTLVRALLAALASAAPPAALSAAAEQWQRGRCVVLACPQSDDPAGPAWAFVLWPRRKQPLALLGRRVAARLQWREPPCGARWCHARLVKEHHPRTGRQLVAMDDTPGCEVQLGPVLAERRRPCEVGLRIDAVRRFWTALGAQWSVHVVVCSLPLAGRAMESPPGRPQATAPPRGADAEGVLGANTDTPC